MSFSSGDHIRVRRPILGPVGYYHHGIFIGDDRVIQFGGGILDKPRATVGAVRLKEFERLGRAEVVMHGGRTWWAAPRFERLPPAEVIANAQRLAKDHPSGLYDLFGYNCEQAATLCATGSYESYQVRGFFAILSLTLLPVYFAARTAGRVSHPLARTLWGLTAALVVASLVANALYYTRGARFMRRVGRKWMAERASPDASR